MTTVKQRASQRRSHVLNHLVRINGPTSHISRNINVITAPCQTQSQVKSFNTDTHNYLDAAKLHYEKMERYKTQAKRKNVQS